jgi:hypothetical protein
LQTSENPLFGMNKKEQKISKDLLSKMVIKM